MQDDPPGRVELAAVVGARRIGPKLQHPSRRAHGARDTAALTLFLRLTYVDEDDISPF